MSFDIREYREKRAEKARRYYKEHAEELRIKAKKRNKENRERKRFERIARMQQLPELMRTLGSKPRLGKIISCIVCRKQFYEKPSASENRKFCSRKCMHSVESTKMTLICEICRREYKTYRSHVKWRGSRFCSRKCLNDFHASRTGENNPSWKGGKTKEYRRLRGTRRWSSWRRSVFERDDYTCKMPGCGKRGGSLEPHHIYGFTDYPLLRFCVDNGITLCRDCHQKTKGHESKYVKTFSDFAHAHPKEARERLDK